MNNKWYTYVGLVCAIWFALTSWIWTSLFNVLYSYPPAALALLIYLYSRMNDELNQTNRWTLILLIFGWMSSIASMWIQNN